MADEKSKPEQIETVGGSGLLEPTIAGVDPPPPPASDDAALPVVSPDLYAREGEVARGGMGRIVATRDRRLGRAVALKELHQQSASSARRFVREALVTARLQHPSIVPVYEAGRWPEGVPFYAMKMVSGRSLDAVIRSSPTLAGRLALLPHVIAVAEAIAYAHSERIIHRDLKPANVLVGSFGETVVVDWGLAKDLSRPAGDEPSEGALGVCLTKLGRYAEAESSLLSAYASLRAAHGEQHERTVEARQRLVALYEAWGKPEKAAPYRTTAVR